MLNNLFPYFIVSVSVYGSIQIMLYIFPSGRELIIRNIMLNMYVGNNADENIVVGPFKSSEVSYS